MLGGIGWQELMIVLVIVMIIFGAGRLPEVMRSMGQGVKEFKKESSDLGGTIASSSTTDTADRDRDRRSETKVVETREMRAEEI
jgi:sec-independent protein translocase protein TatA